MLVNSVPIGRDGVIYLIRTRLTDITYLHNWCRSPVNTSNLAHTHGGPHRSMLLCGGYTEYVYKDLFGTPIKIVRRIPYLWSPWTEAPHLVVDVLPETMTLWQCIKTKESAVNYPLDPHGNIDKSAATVLRSCVCSIPPLFPSKQRNGDPHKISLPPTNAVRL